MTGKSFVVSQRKVHDTSLVERAVLKGHPPVQSEALLIGEFTSQLPQSLVMDQDPEADGTSVVWMTVVGTEISSD